METEIGIIGGSGFYELLSNAESKKVATSYGDPSSPVSIGKIGKKSVAFIARHGPQHTIPPHKVNYRANIGALSDLGAKRVLASNAIGSLKVEYAPGDLVFFDQFVNMTHGRIDTFYDSDVVAHVSTAEPYCEQLRKDAIKIAKEMEIPYHEGGTIVVINGPRFSTKAESRHFSAMGFDVIGMTQYPEAALAREKALCYLGIGMVTDYDAGLEGREDIKPVTSDQVKHVFEQNVVHVKELMRRLVPKISENRECACASALDGAVMTKAQKPTRIV